MGKKKKGSASSDGNKLLKLAETRPKGKCCKSTPRCLKCPVVIHRLNREIANGNVDYGHLKSVVEKVRNRKIDKNKVR